MSELGDKIRNIGDTWADVYVQAQATPGLWQPQWPNGDLVVLDETVRTLVNLIDRERAPSGFGPGYQLAKALVAATIPNLQTAVAQLAAKQYNYLPSFAAQILDAISRVHSVILFSDKEAKDVSSADLRLELAEALSLLGTAQRELAAKQGQLATVESLANSVVSSAAAAESASEDATAAKNTAASTLEEIDSRKNQVEEAAEAVAVAQKKIEEAVSATDRKFESSFSEAQKKLNELLTETRAATAGATAADVALSKLLEQANAQNAVINQILPKAAGAGLADAFRYRTAQLQWIKWVWMIVFAATLFTIGWGAIAAGKLPSTFPELWPELVWRIAKAAPLVWLAWVSISQYGNITRVQEDYAFKEATSRAFQGYRDHMEHLRSVGDEEAGNALKLLATRTIEILAQEPLRVYMKPAKANSPTNALFSELLERLERIAIGKKMPESE
ncbi:MAG TPA: hypothetical protein VMF52_00130 [Steroidobacteraceae bacterium]|nr:hypothetical protein [Steroidobacteraceae bacterium]